MDKKNTKNPIKIKKLLKNMNKQFSKDGIPVKTKY